MPRYLSKAERKVLRLLNPAAYVKVKIMRQKQRRSQRVLKKV